jgi:hypothetical protein
MSRSYGASGLDAGISQPSVNVPPDNIDASFALERARRDGCPIVLAPAFVSVMAVIRATTGPGSRERQRGVTATQV